MNLITRYLEYKKNKLISYGLALFSGSEYHDFLIECLKKYINNYIEVKYHQQFETVSDNAKVTKEVIEEEQVGMRLELLDDLSVKEIIETNEGYTRKQELINITSSVAKTIIKIDNLDLTEYNKDEKLDKVLKEASKEFPIRQNSKTLIVKIWKEDEGTIKKILTPKDNFTLNLISYENKINEVRLTPEIKQLNLYKKSLVERVYHEEKVVYEELKLMVILLNKLILEKLIKKEEIGTYMIIIPDEIWTKKPKMEELYELLEDKILKEHILLGITYNTLINNKSILDKRKEKYNFVALQDFTHINDIPTKISNIDASNVCDYLMITAYKDKDFKEFENIEVTSMKGILFSKEG